MGRLRLIPKKESFQPGNRVLVYGLINAPQYNGKFGTIKNKVDGGETHRYQVILDDGTEIACRPQNLQQEFRAMLPEKKKETNLSSMRVGDGSSYSIIIFEKYSHPTNVNEIKIPQPGEEQQQTMIPFPLCIV